jgi:SAM-dependent methyltransferase
VTTQQSWQPPRPSRETFEKLYRGEPTDEGVPAPTSIPWDIHQAQPRLMELEALGGFSGEVLDIGCGLGDNAIYLAQHGHSVTGLDISPTALITAERRAADAGVNVRFAAADATKLDGYTDAFDTVIDSGMFHCLDDDGKRRYAAALRRATRADARLLLGCFSDANAADAEWPRPMVSEQTLRDTLGGAGWDITSLQPVTLRRDDRPEMAFWLVQADRRSVPAGA